MLTICQDEIGNKVKVTGLTEFVLPEVALALLVLLELGIAVALAAEWKLALYLPPSCSLRNNRLSGPTLRVRYAQM